MKAHEPLVCFDSSFLAEIQKLSPQPPKLRLLPPIKTYHANCPHCGWRKKIPAANSVEAAEIACICHARHSSAQNYHLHPLAIINDASARDSILRENEGHSVPKPNLPSQKNDTPPRNEIECITEKQNFDIQDIFHEIQKGLFEAPMKAREVSHLFVDTEPAPLFPLINVLF